jgi:aspartate racemase
MKKMIGIVGGVGSYAGIDLIKKIYDNTEAITDQEHLPVSMLSAPHKVKDRTEYLIGKIKENPGIAIAEIITTLSRHGAEIIGIPCNTAHTPKIFNVIKQNTPDEIQLVHLIEEVGKFITNNHPEIKKVGVLSTNGTFIADVYPSILANFGIEAIHPSEEIQKNVCPPCHLCPGVWNQSIFEPGKRKGKERSFNGCLLSVKKRL